jgi:large subunit ribosomal protein L28
MSRECELSGKSPMTGHRVSHSNVKSKRRFLPNLVNVTLHSETLARSFKMRIAASTLRTVDKHGGLDGYLLKTKTTTLHEKAQKILSDIEKKQAEAAA